MNVIRRRVMMVAYVLTEWTLFTASVKAGLKGQHVQLVTAFARTHILTFNTYSLPAKYICDCFFRYLDVNECINSGPCLNNANCTNTPGSYFCSCAEGYRGDNCSGEAKLN